MNTFLEITLSNGLLLDALGVTGLGILALAAVHLVRKNDRLWGGSMLGYGAVALWFIIAFFFNTKMM